MKKDFRLILYKIKIKSLKKKWLYKIYKEETVWKKLSNWIKEYPELIYDFSWIEICDWSIKWIENNF